MQDGGSQAKQSPTMLAGQKQDVTITDTSNGKDLSHEDVEASVANSGSHNIVPDSTYASQNAFAGNHEHDEAHQSGET